MKLLQDFGVSALALTLILSIMGVGGILLIWQKNQEFALAWIGSFAALAFRFYEGYVQKRKEEHNNNKPP